MPKQRAASGALPPSPKAEQAKHFSSERPCSAEPGPEVPGLLTAREIKCVGKSLRAWGGGSARPARLGAGVRG